MTAPKSGPISADRLKSLIERIERLLEERKAIGGDIRDVFLEAKSIGYDVRTMRAVIKLRTIDPAERDEQEHLLDTYAHALGMVVSSGAAISDIGANEEVLLERAAKVVREVDQCAMLLVGGDGAPPKIEAIKTLIGCSTGKAHKLRSLVIERLAGFSPKNARNGENETGNSAHEGEEHGNGICRDSGRPRRDDGGESARRDNRSANDRDGSPDGHDGRHASPAGRHAEPDREPARTVRADASVDRSRQGDADTAADHRSSAGNARFPEELGEHDGRGASPAGRDLPAAGRAAVAVAVRGVDAPSTPPLGAVAEAQPERVASTEIDLTPPPALLAKRKEIDQRRAS